MLKVIKFLLIQKWLSIYSACITEYTTTVKRHIYFDRKL